MADPEIDAVRAVRALACPACGAPSRCIAFRPHHKIRGMPIICLRCEASVVVFDDEATWRDGVFAWNAWVRKTRELRMETDRG